MADTVGTVEMNKTFVIREQRNLDVLNAYLKGWEDAVRIGKPWQVDIGPEKAKRSNIQNRYYWNLLNQISEQVWIEGKQYDSSVYHELFKRKFIGCVDLPGAGLMAMSSTDLSQKEFGEYVDKVTADAAVQFGVVFMDHEQ